MHEKFQKLAYAAQHPIETSRIGWTARMAMFSVVAFGGTEITDGVLLATGDMPLKQGAAMGVIMLCATVNAANVLTDQIELNDTEENARQSELV